MRYVARDGKVYVVRNGREEERATACTANGRDLARFDIAQRIAKLQRVQSSLDAAIAKDVTAP